MVILWAVVITALIALWNLLSSMRSYRRGYVAGANKVLDEWKEHLNKSEEE